MDEYRILFALPFVRGLQYIHAALLSQGAHCVKPGQAKQDAATLFEQADKLSEMIHSGTLPDYV